MNLYLSNKHLSTSKRFHCFGISITVFLILFFVNEIANSAIYTVVPDTPANQKEQHPWRFYDRWSVGFDGSDYDDARWSPVAKNLELTRWNGADLEVVPSGEPIYWGSDYRVRWDNTDNTDVNIRYEWWTFQYRKNITHDSSSYHYYHNIFFNKTTRQVDEYVEHSEFKVTDETGEYREGCLGVIAFNLDNGDVLGSYTNCNLRGNEEGVVTYSGRIGGNRTITAVVSDANGLDGVDIDYQWQWKRDGGSWRNFNGHTGASFKLKRKWAGKRHVRVMVTYTDNRGADSETVYGPKIRRYSYLFL